MEEDKGNIGWGILGFFIPIVGLILYIVWYKTKPKCAKQAGIGALIRVILKMILIFLMIVCTVVFFFVSRHVSKLDGGCKYYGNVRVCCDRDMNCEASNHDYDERIILDVNGTELEVNLEDNVSSRALIGKLKENDIRIEAHDYGNFEKVGTIDFDLPRSDETITTKPGDLILYNGNQISLYYDVNTWSLTKLGHIEISEEELKELLKDEKVVLILKYNRE